MLHKELLKLYNWKSVIPESELDAFENNKVNNLLVSKILFFIHLVKNDLIPVKLGKIQISKKLKEGYSHYLDQKEGLLEDWDYTKTEIKHIDELENFFNNSIKEFTEIYSDTNFCFIENSHFQHVFEYEISGKLIQKFDPYFFLDLIIIINNYKKNMGINLIKETEYFLRSIYFQNFQNIRIDGIEGSLSDYNKIKITPSLINYKKIKKKDSKYSIYNPFSGLGSYGIAFIYWLGQDNVKIINEDINYDLVEIAKLRYLIHFNSLRNVQFNYGIINYLNIGSVISGEGLGWENDYIDEIQKKYNLSYDITVSNPPYRYFLSTKESAIGRVVNKYKIQIFFNRLAQLSKCTIISCPAYGTLNQLWYDELYYLMNIEKILCLSNDKISSSRNIHQIYTYFMYSNKYEGLTLNKIEESNIQLTYLTEKEYNPHSLSFSYDDINKKNIRIKFLEVFNKEFNVNLYIFQKQLNINKYKRIDDLTTEFKGNEIKKINYKNLSIERQIKLNKLPYVTSRQLHSNKLDFYTLDIDFNENIPFKNPSVYDEKNSKISILRPLLHVKTSCILVSITGVRFGFIDKEKYPNGVLINSGNIIPLKVKWNCDPKFIISSMFESSFIEQLGVVKNEKIFLNHGLIKKLKVYYEENAKRRADIIERNTQNEISSFLNTRNIKKFRGYEIKESYDLETGKSIFYKDGILVDNDSEESSNKYDANTDDTALPTQLPEDMYDPLDIDIDKLSENDIKKNAISVSKIKDFIKKTKGEEKNKESQEQQIREGIIEELSRFTGQYAHKLKNYLKPIASNSLSLTEIVKKFKSKIEKNQFERIIENIENIDEALDKTRNTINKFDDAVISTIRNKDLPLKDISHIKLMEIIDQNLDRFNDVEYINNFKVIENNYEIISNKNYLENIFQNISDNAKKHSGSSKINLNGEIVMLKKEKFWEDLKSDIDKISFDEISKNFLDNPYLLIEIEFNGARIPKDVNYNVFTKFGGSYGQSSNTGIGGFKIKEGIINSGGFFYYKHFEEKNYFKIYIPLKENDEIVSKSNLEKLSMILWR